VASIEKRVRNGKTTYCVRYRDPAGGERRKVFARKVDAERWRVENEHGKATGTWVDPAAGRTRFGEWAERWYKTTAALKPSTRHYYRQLLDGQVLPTFERAALADIDRMAVREWLAGLTEGGLGASRVRNAHAVLSMVLGSAVDANRLVRNPAAGMRGLPRRPEVEMHFLSAVEVERLAATIDPRYRVLVLVGAYTGLRPGELAALKVKRLDLLRGTVEVAEHLGEVNGRLVWGSPKTWERRAVRLPRFLAAEVGAHLAGLPSAPDDLVFTAPRGGPLREHKLMERYFKPAAVRSGLPATLRMHDLRHSAASLLIREGASIKALQKMLGHKTATQTLDRYGHLYGDELDSLADRLERLHAAIDPAQVWPHGGPTVVQIATGAGQ
jgi:integrase